MNSHEVFIHIHQGCFAGTAAIVRLPQCQGSKPGGYGKISQYITTTKHSKAKTVCIFLGIYCICGFKEWRRTIHHSIYIWSDYHKNNLCLQQEWSIKYVWLASDTGWLENRMHLSTMVDNYIPSVKSNINLSHFACPVRHKQYIIFFETIFPYWLHRIRRAGNTNCTLNVKIHNRCSNQLVNRQMSRDV